jgi:hypothetical protein
MWKAWQIGGEGHPEGGANDTYDSIESAKEFIDGSNAKGEFKESKTKFKEEVHEIRWDYTGRLRDEAQKECDKIADLSNSVDEAWEKVKKSEWKNQIEEVVTFFAIDKGGKRIKADESKTKLKEYTGNDPMIEWFERGITDETILRLIKNGGFDKKGNITIDDIKKLRKDYNSGVEVKLPESKTKKFSKEVLTITEKSKLYFNDKIIEMSPGDKIYKIGSKVCILKEDDYENELSIIKRDNGKYAFVGPIPNDKKELTKEFDDYDDALQMLKKFNIKLTK